MSTAVQRTARSGAAVFWQYWTGSTISGLGTAITTVALPLTAVTVVRASALSVGLIAAAGDLPWLVLGLPAGVLVARLPPRGAQVGMDLIRALAIGSIPVLAWAGALSSAQLVAVALVVGSATVLFKVGPPTVTARSPRTCCPGCWRPSDSALGLRPSELCSPAHLPAPSARGRRCGCWP